MIIILILAISFWLGGYLMTVRTMSNIGVLSDELEKIVAPPKWLYYLFGAPKAKEYPRGTMRVAAFRAQILGITWMIYIIWSGLWKTSEIENAVGFGLSCVLALIITSYVSKSYRVSDRAMNRKKKKAV